MKKLDVHRDFGSDAMAKAGFFTIFEKKFYDSFKA